MEQFKRIAMRFVRGAVAGAVASMLAFLAAGVTITDADGLKTLAFALCTSAISGALLALDKLVREGVEPEA